MEQEGKPKEEPTADPAGVCQPTTEVKKPRPGTTDSLQALQASETRYRRLFETAQDGILILNAETGEIDDVNPYMIDMLHYSHEEFLGKQLWEVSPFKDTILNQAAFEELKSNGYIRYKDLPLETKEGKRIAVEFVSNVYRDNGNLVIQCNIRNITESKEVRQKLQNTLIFQQLLIDALPVPVFYKDLEGRYLGCNTSFENFFGQTREQIMGKSVYDLSSKTFADIYHEKDRALLQNPGIQVYESTVKDAGGVVHYVTFHKATFSKADGSPGGLIGAILDITDLKEAEERYKNIFDNAQEGIFRSTPDGKIILANQALAKMFGYASPEEGMTSIANVFSQHYVNPEDRTRLKELIEEQGFIKGYETQCFRKDRSIIWISLTVHPVRNERGQIIYYEGINQDVTERKLAEAERERMLFRQQEVNQLQQSLLVQGALDEKLKAVTDSIVSVFGADFSRIWVIQPGDLCERGCIHADATEEFHVCRYRDRCLHLMASSGRYTHTDSTSHGRVPFGCYKIGRIASEDDHRFLTNDVQNDPRVHNHEWAQELGLLSFAGYQLRVPNGKTLGVLALFAKHPISSAEDTMLDGLSNTIALVIQRDAAEKLLRKSLIGTIQTMSLIVETRDPYTAGHQRRVSILARAIAQDMNLPNDTVDSIRMAGSLHDIGKISVPAEILSKPTKLTELEFSLIKVHSQAGYDILKNAGLPYPIAEIVLQHHERLDGSGYPQGLKGDQILLEARILTVADVVEAIASHRPYRPGFGIDAALKEIETNKGILFDGRVVGVCHKLFQEKGFSFETKP